MEEDPSWDDSKYQRMFEALASSSGVPPEIFYGSLVSQGLLPPLPEDREYELLRDCIGGGR